MKKLIGFLAIASLFTCTQDNLSEVLDENGSGIIRLSVKLDQSFEGGNGADSPWNHTYQSEATVTFTSTTSVFKTSGDKRTIQVQENKAVWLRASESDVMYKPTLLGGSV